MMKDANVIVTKISLKQPRFFGSKQHHIFPGEIDY
jgi:hypothetical protein